MRKCAMKDIYRRQYGNVSINRYATCSNCKMEMLRQVVGPRKDQRKIVKRLRASVYLPCNSCKRVVLHPIIALFIRRGAMKCWWWKGSSCCLWHCSDAVHDVGCRATLNDLAAQSARFLDPEGGSQKAAVVVVVVVLVLGITSLWV